jgi:hypothetical protein
LKITWVDAQDEETGTFADYPIIYLGHKSGASIADCREPYYSFQDESPSERKSSIVERKKFMRKPDKGNLLNFTITDDYKQVLESAGIRQEIRLRDTQ